MKETKGDEFYPEESTDEIDKVDKRSVKVIKEPKEDLKDLKEKNKTLTKKQKEVTPAEINTTLDMKDKLDDEKDSQKKEETRKKTNKPVANKDEELPTEVKKD